MCERTAFLFGDIADSWREPYMKKCAEEEPAALIPYSSPFWPPTSQIADIANKPVSSDMRVEIPATNRLIRILSNDNGKKLKKIMENTNTLISIKEQVHLTEPKVVICGSMSAIRKAKREVVNFMPIDLIFDTLSYTLSSVEIINISNYFDLRLGMEKKEGMAFWVKMTGSEGYVQNIYKAYEEILRFQSTAVNRKKGPTIEVLRYAQILNHNGIFDDLHLENFIADAVEEKNRLRDSIENILANRGYSSKDLMKLTYRYKFLKDALKCCEVDLENIMNASKCTSLFDVAPGSVKQKKI